MAEPTPRHATWRSWRSLALLPPLLLGAAFFMWQLRSAEGPSAPAAVERAVPVQVAIAEQRTVIPRAIGFGTVVPARTYHPTAEVQGTVVERHPRLERGRLLPAGTVVIRIDDSDYRLAKLGVEAEIRRLQAEIERIEVRRTNLERSIALERRALTIVEDDRARQERLFDRGSASRASLDQAISAVLDRQDRLETDESSLAEIEPELAVREAELAVLEVELQRAELDLARTAIALPFDARVGDVEVEIGEFVSRGQVVASFDGVAKAEVDGQFALSQVRGLVPPDLDLDPGALDLVTLRALPQRLGLTAEVRLRERGIDATWPATFDRPSDRMDPETRSFGLIVTVDDPYGQVEPGRRPPLTRNMYVEVIVEGQPQQGQLVVPAAAIRRVDDGPRLFVVDDDDRLAIRPVRVTRTVGDLAIIGSGIAAGDRVVIGALSPAIEGMRLAPELAPGVPLPGLVEAGS
ncbi:MAG: hypothetical protein AAFX81_10785 [Pseudomonadota bacterium]